MGGTGLEPGSPTRDTDGQEWPDADASPFSTGVRACQRLTGVDTTDTRFRRPCGRNVDGIELGVEIPTSVELNGLVPLK
jgi:hypothetical protein